MTVLASLMPGVMQLGMHLSLIYLALQFRTCFKLLKGEMEDRGTLSDRNMF